MSVYSHLYDADLARLIHEFDKKIEAAEAIRDHAIVRRNNYVLEQQFRARTLDNSKDRY